MIAPMGIGDNLKRLRGERGLSQKALAELSGVSQQLLSQIERGINRTTKELPDLARALGVGVHEIDESYPAPDAGVSEASLEPRPAGLALVSSFDPDQPDPEYDPDARGTKASTGHSHKLTPGAIAEIEVRGGAGGGGVVTQGIASDGRTTYSADVVRAEWVLPPAFVRDELHLTFGRTEIIAIRGDSMEPDLRDGDRVMIDRTDTNLRQGGIFAVSDNGEIIVKQVELLRESDPPQIVCTSRNERYRPVTLTLDGSTFIIGRVAARISRM